VLNETAVRSLNLKSPVIGGRFINKGDTGMIIGIVKDFHFKSLHQKIGPMVISFQPGKANSLYVKTYSGRESNAIAAAEKIWKTFAPDFPFSYNFVDESYRQLYSEEQRSYFLLTVFTFVALALSAMGLFGLSTFEIEQRVKEISIRKVLGASVMNIAWFLSLNFVIMVVISVLISFPIAWWLMHEWLRGFAYRAGLSWWMFATGALLALCIALLTISIQTIRAAGANPAKNIKYE
jgi:putative ABC transport system permease protein